MMGSAASLDRCIRGASEIPRLTRDEEHALAVRARAGEQDAIDELVRAHLRFVVVIALKYRRYDVPLGDLIGEGTVGLMTAVDKFDPDRGTRFVTYAGYWIRACVIDAVCRAGTLVGAGRGPFHTKLFFRLRRERAKLSSQIADPAERMSRLATELGMSVEKVTELLHRLDHQDVSLDAPAFRDTATTVMEMLPASTEPQDEWLERKERRDRVQARMEAALSVLDDRERVIIEERILGDEKPSLASLGRRFGVGRERARQLEVRAKKKLAGELTDLVPPT